jgi:parallel beta-helix repeat protein
MAQNTPLEFPFGVKNLSDYPADLKSHFKLLASMVALPVPIRVKGQLVFVEENGNYYLWNEGTSGTIADWDNKGSDPFAGNIPYKNIKDYIDPIEDLVTDSQGTYIDISEAFARIQAENAQGCGIYVPNEVFETSTGIDVFSGFEIFSDGKYTGSIKARDIDAQLGLHTGVLTINSSNVVIRDITVDGNFRANQAFEDWNYSQGSDNVLPNRSLGIALLPDSRNCIIKDVYVKNTSRHNILVMGEDHRLLNLNLYNANSYNISMGSTLAPISSGTAADKTRRIFIHNCFMEKVHGKRNFEINDGVRDCVFSSVVINCYDKHNAMIVHDHNRPNESNDNLLFNNFFIYNSTNEAVLIESAVQNKNSRLRFVNLNMYNTRDLAVRVKSKIENLSFEDCYIQARTAIHINRISGDIIPENITIKNCIIQGNSLGTSTLEGVYVNECKNLTLSNSQIFNFVNGGIRLIDTVDSTLINNRIFDNVNRGIRLSGNNIDLKIIDRNRFYNKNNNDQTVSIQNDSDEGNISISQNKFTNTTAYAGDLVDSYIFENNQGLDDNPIRFGFIKMVVIGSDETVLINFETRENTAIKINVSLTTTNSTNQVVGKGYILLANNDGTLTEIFNTVSYEYTDNAETSSLKVDIEDESFDLIYEKTTPGNSNLRLDYNINIIELSPEEFSYDPATIAVLAEYPSALTESQELALNSLIVGWKAEGLWDITDEIGVFYNTTQGNAVIKLKNPLNTFSLENSPTFTAFEGFQGDGVDDYINTNFKLNSLTHFTQNNCSIYVNGELANASTMFGSRSTVPNTRFHLQTFSGNVSFTINNASGIGVGTYEDVAEDEEHFLVWRNNTTHGNLYVGNKTYSGAANSVARSTNDLLLLARAGNSNDAEDFSTSKISIFAIGASFHLKFSEIKDIVETFKSNFTA